MKRSGATHLTLPGGRFAVANAAEMPRLAISAARVLGPQVRHRLRHPDRRFAERRWAAAAVAQLGMRIELAGLEHIDPAASYVVTPLHEGFADIPALLASLPLSLRFVARSELAQWPLLGATLAAGGHPFVTPERGVAAYRSLVRKAQGVFTRGESLVIFPQGTILGIETGFSRGAFHLAALSRRPLLPVVISGTHRIWEHPFSPLVRFDQAIAIQVLRPISAEAALASQRLLERRMKHAALSNSIAPRRYVPERDGWWDGYHFTIDPEFAELAARLEERRRLQGSAAATRKGAPATRRSA